MEACGGQGVYIPASSTCDDCEAFNQRLTEAEDRLDSLESQTETMSEQISTLEETAETLTEQVSSHDDSITELQDDVSLINEIVNSQVNIALTYSDGTAQTGKIIFLPERLPVVGTAVEGIDYTL